MYAFEIEKPSTVAEAVKALKAEGAQALGGGHTLIPTLKARLAAPAVLVSLQGIAEMKGVTASGGTLTVGGGTTHGAVADEAGRLSGAGGAGGQDRRSGGAQSAAPSAARWPMTIPRPAIRRRRWPSGATIVTDRREIAADDFFQGMFTTALDEGEIITAVKFPIPEKANYQKFIQPASRFALVGVFVAKYPGGVRVAVTGASESGVFRWTEAEAALSASFTKAAVAGLKASAEGLIGDIHGSPEYRAHLIGVLTGRAVEAAA